MLMAHILSIKVYNCLIMNNVQTISLVCIIGEQDPVQLEKKWKKTKDCLIESDYVNYKEPSNR